MSIAIRDAKPEDADWIVSRLPALSAMYQTKRPLYEDPIYARDGVLSFIRDHLFLIGLDGDDRRGFIAGMVSDHFVNPEIRTLTEMLWWVDPGPSQPRVGLALLRGFTEWGRRHADWITFTRLDAHPSGHRALTRLGFRLQERIYLLEVD